MHVQYSTNEFEQKYTYDGEDLGAVYTPERTVFRVWAPLADSVTVNLYTSGNAGEDDLIDRLVMKPDVNGTWTAEKADDLNGVYYTYLVSRNGETQEACDPYARTTGVNGERAMVIDLALTNPKGWDKDCDPHGEERITDAVIYELHIRDISSDRSAGIRNVGKFLGLVETGTVTPSGIPTGLDHMKELGITHVHLLPVADYGSVDEKRLEEAQFNWGYDPVNYNVPEGSYSTDPYHGEVRVREMKQMVKTLHDNGISVVLDVVYNHVYDADEFCFNKIVPGYFSRIDAEGNYSAGSGCENDNATERSMVRKYIVDSVAYWADEYHIDGFRFDLVGLIDIETVRAVMEKVSRKHPNVIFYGEGWTMGTGLTKEGVLLATQNNSAELPGFAFFSDTMRDGLRGHVFYYSQRGYISGGKGLANVIEQCFLGKAPDWCKTPSQSVNYASCHDNYTLMDRITLAAPEASWEEWVRMNNLAAVIYMTAEGIPFLQAGEEMLRRKLDADGNIVENSFKSPDFINGLKWDCLNEKTYQDVYAYYRGLIAFRKAHRQLRLTTPEEVERYVTPVEGLPKDVVAMRIAGDEGDKKTDGIFAIFNPNRTAVEINLPEGVWSVCINAERAGTDPIEMITGEKVKVEPISATVLVKLRKKG
ncbi:MAG: type I pullulanase [Roseburia sp.]|nr:type I pullulanase [Roseburia sp.]